MADDNGRKQVNPLAAVAIVVGALALIYFASMAFLSNNEPGQFVIPQTLHSVIYGGVVAIGIAVLMLLRNRGKK